MLNFLTPQNLYDLPSVFRNNGYYDCSTRDCAYGGPPKIVRAWHKAMELWAVQFALDDARPREDLCPAHDQRLRGRHLLRARLGQIQARLHNTLVCLPS